MNRPRDRCSVCQMPTISFNYGTLLCNACKMFYNRSSIAKKIEECKMDGLCYDDSKDLFAYKPRCRACRYAKCLLHVKKASNSPISASSLSSSSSSPMYLARSLSSFSDSSLETVSSGRKYSELLEDSAALSHLSQINERRRLLCRSFKVTGNPSYLEIVNWDISFSPHSVSSTDQEQRLDPGWILGVVAVEEAFKSMDFHDSLSLNDQLILLKRGALKSYHFSMANDSYNLGEMSQQHVPFKRAYQTDNYGNVLQKYETALVDRLGAMKLQTHEYLLLNTILLCNPGHSGLSPNGQEIVSKTQWKYARALLNACIQSDPQEGHLRYADLLALEKLLDNQLVLTKNIIDTLQENDPNIVIPKVVEEVFKVPELTKP